MLKPLTQFYCDCCGEVIQEPKHGWVEWLIISNRGEDYYFKGFRIVHHRAYSPLKEQGAHCYTYQNHLDCADSHLTEFLNPQTGIVQLLRFIDPGEIHEPQYKGPRFKDLRPYIEFMRRLTIPYYEQARLYWPEAIRDNFFDGGSETFVYAPANLKRLIEEYGGGDALNCFYLK